MFDDDHNRGACIKVIGVGGAGGNAVNTMIEAGLEGVQFIVANTDTQALSNSLTDIKIQIGESRTSGLGAGSNPQVGRESATESAALIQEQLKGAHMVFVTAGMGGGTGTGAAPVIAAIARELGALTVGVVTKPFKFEGKRRRRYAEEGLEILRNNVDTLITIPNERLLQTVGDQVPLMEAFRQADGVLLNAVRSISELITRPGLVNTDFADVRTVMSCKGLALMGTGVGSGPNRATEAAEAAISSPLLDDISLEGATSVLLNITAPRTATLIEISEAATLIEDATADDALIIWGHVFSDDEADDIKITIIATGFDHCDAQDVGVSQMRQAGQSGFGQYGRSGYGQSYTSSPHAAVAASSMSRGQTVAQGMLQFHPDQGYASGQPVADIAQKMQALDAQSDNMFAPPSMPRPSASYAPVSKSAMAGGGAGTQAFMMMDDVQPRDTIRTSAVARSSAETGAVIRPASLDYPLDEDSLDTPAFLRRNPSKKYFMD